MLCYHKDYYATSLTINLQCTNKPVLFFITDYNHWILILTYLNGYEKWLNFLYYFNFYNYKYFIIVLLFSETPLFQLQSSGRIKSICEKTKDIKQIKFLKF
jgi:hypothetical protein